MSWAERADARVHSVYPPGIPIEQDVCAAWKKFQPSSPVFTGYKMLDGGVPSEVKHLSNWRKRKKSQSYIFSNLTQVNWREYYFVYSLSSGERRGKSPNLSVQ